jgi:UDP-N-acetylglucosamine diphosphorylase / glucose-1-phosphate thymidylyltransferase / UDP-N-acetylgalactosamine diphosphorylase / glucosamine-1-phosphate N-acetyltransferase / galactosamine-1-phosphate N-acetyltransferase
LQIIIVEDNGYRKFLPLTATRPAFDLICGTQSIIARILFQFSIRRPYIIVRDEIRDVFLERNPSARTGIPGNADSLFINGRALLSKPDVSVIGKAKRKKSAVLFRNQEEWVGYYIPKDHNNRDVEAIIRQDPSGFHGADEIDLFVPVVRYPWEILDRNSEMIELDFKDRVRTGREKIRSPISSRVHIINKKHVLVGPNTDIQPLVVIDASHGPVIIDSDVVIQSHAYISGPVWIGPKTIVRAGARISGGSSIGHNCRVGGEINSSIMHGFSNKAHDGFLGHAYVGQWVNIGAATNNSNLKNDYGPVSVMVDGEPVNTGRQFFGMVMGDHSRTAISTTINTGSNIGVGCNIFGTDFPPRFLHDFSWGGSDILRIYDFDKFLKSAHAMTARRDVTLSDAEIQLLKKLFELRKRKP